MQLNEGKFSANGRCGYVLKPHYLMDETFKPDQVYAQSNENNESLTKNCFPICMTLQVIAGKHLSRKDHNKGICSPFVEIEIVGLLCDTSVERTCTISNNIFIILITFFGKKIYLASNGLNPIWNNTFVFNILRPELALLRFLVEDGDFVGPKTDPFIG